MQARTKLNTTILAFLLAQQSPVGFTKRNSAYDSLIAIEDLVLLKKSLNPRRKARTWISDKTRIEKNCVVIRVLGLLKLKYTGSLSQHFKSMTNLELSPEPLSWGFFCRSVIAKKVCL